MKESIGMTDANALSVFHTNSLMPIQMEPALKLCPLESLAMDFEATIARVLLDDRDFHSQQPQAGQLATMNKKEGPKNRSGMNWSSVGTDECFNSRSQAHQMDTCPAPFCGKCKTFGHHLVRLSLTAHPSASRSTAPRPRAPTSIAGGRERGASLR